MYANKVFPLSFHDYGERDGKREREKRAATRKYADNAWPLFGGREGRGEHGFLPRSEIQARI